MTNEWTSDTIFVGVPFSSECDSVSMIVNFCSLVWQLQKGAPASSVCKPEIHKATADTKWALVQIYFNLKN